MGSMSWDDAQRESMLRSTLLEMKNLYENDPEAAVRSQEFIQRFHQFIANDLNGFLTPQAKKAGVRVVQEAKIFGSFKSKDVDVAVIHPENGPLLLVGVRSQMSSISKNVLTYYQDIIGEAISLQERFPMCTTGYAYLHPYEVQPLRGKNGTQKRGERLNHSRYARMYAGIGSRDDRLYKHQLGAYDQFAYSVVDFQKEQPELMDSVVRRAVPDLDMSILSFVPRLIETFNVRNLWIQDIFVPTETEKMAGDTLPSEELDNVLLADGGS